MSAAALIPKDVIMRRHFTGAAVLGALASALMLMATSTAAIAAPTSTTKSQGPAFYVDEASLPFEPLHGASAHWGILDGAGYRIEIPANWNGELVMYARGFTVSAALTVADPPNRRRLIESGFAWASSSNRTNGYDPGQGMKDTHRLHQYVLDTFGDETPITRSYAMGSSMGGHVVGLMVEKWPQEFDGAFAECGNMGDVALSDYYQDVYLAGATITGQEPTVPVPVDYSTNALPKQRQAMATNFPRGLNETGERFKNLVMMLTGGERPLFDEGWTGGILPFSSITAAQGWPGAGDGLDNNGRVYQFDADRALTPEEQEFNDDILRFTGTPPQRTEKRWSPREGTTVPRLTGDISIPVMTTHTVGELFVPFSMEQIYAEKVANKDRSDMLVQRAIRDVLHCGFSDAERDRAFDDLVHWVKTGEKPLGDDILNPAAVADPQFGCRFTEGDAANYGISISRTWLPQCEEPQTRVALP